mgnify:CR=1 FL=1
MVNQEKLAPYLEGLELGAWRYFHEVGSSNDHALAWASSGASDWSLVVADSQTAGRGRKGRRWVTTAGEALAMSLVLRPSEQEIAHFSRFTALAALGLIQALGKMGLQGEIKWPNDILLGKEKVAGVLVEADWQGNEMNGLVVGMGVNITQASVPERAQLRYPATSIEAVLGKKINRWRLLVDILSAMMTVRSYLSEDAFVREWNEKLAFRGDCVVFRLPGENPEPMRLVGVTQGGQLSLELTDGQRIEAVSGEIL